MMAPTRKKLITAVARETGIIAQSGTLINPAGELWNAVSRTPIKADEDLVIEKLEGLTLDVRSTQT